MSELNAAQAVKDAEQAKGALASGAVRAAVLGVNDGLVTNVALLLGVAGAAVDVRYVRLAGLASLVAGALSMAVGEYVSMRAQVDLLKRLLADEEAALRADPAGERRRLAGILRQRGFGRALADAVAARMIRTPESAVETYARAQLGLDPNDLGSPWAAALSSLLTFAGGALVPLLPWFFFSGERALYGSIALAAAAALLVGGVLGQLAERRWLRWALRQLAIVAFAASATWLIGHLFGAPVA